MPAIRMNSLKSRAMPGDLSNVKRRSPLFHFNPNAYINGKRELRWRRHTLSLRTSILFQRTLEMKTPLSKTARTLPVVDRTSRVPIVSEEVKFLDSRSLPRLRAPSKLKLLGSNSSSCRQVSAGGAGPGCRAPGPAPSGAKAHSNLRRYTRVIQCDTL